MSFHIFLPTVFSQLILLCVCYTSTYPLYIYKLVQSYFSSNLLVPLVIQGVTSDSQAEIPRIIQVAAKLLKSDIKSVSQSRDTFPHAKQISAVDEAVFLLDSLYALLKTTDRRVLSNVQAVMQAASPHMLTALLQIEHAVQPSLSSLQFLLSDRYSQ